MIECLFTMIEGWLSMVLRLH